MLNNKVLECLEQNIEGLERLSYFMKYGEEFACRDLILEINMDQFEGYECLLPVILLTSDDPVIGRTEKRLLLQLYSERIQELGARRWSAALLIFLTKNINTMKQGANASGSLIRKVKCKAYGVRF